MRVVVNGKQWKPRTQNVVEVKDKQGIRNKVLQHIERNAGYYAGAAVFVLTVVLPGTAEAASGGGGMRLIKLMQKATFWLGLAVSIWGIVEMQLDLPGWTGRIMKGVLGYVAILLIPLVFLELEGTLAVDVWEQIEKAR